MKPVNNRFGEPIRDAVDVDETDARILELLQADARLSARALSRQIGMSPGAVSERIARLEREGVIAGYHAAIDSSALGHGLVAIIGLRSTPPILLEAVERLTLVAEVETIYVVTGQWDMMVHVRVRDHHHLSEVLFDRVLSDMGFKESATMIVLHQRRGPRIVPSRTAEM